MRAVGTGNSFGRIMNKSGGGLMAPVGPDEARYTVGDLARHVGVSTRTIKRWQSKGLIPAPAMRNDKGWGLWTSAQAREVLALRHKKIRKGWPE